jgi:hypothetical protein
MRSEERYVHRIIQAHGVGQMRSAARQGHWLVNSHSRWHEARHSRKGGMVIRSLPCSPWEPLSGAEAAQTSNRIGEYHF